MSAVIYDQASADKRVALRNVAAEARAVEDGRQCRYNPQTGRFEVKSEDGRTTYSLTASAQGDLLVMSCNCKAGRLGAQRPAGEIGCRHRGRLARKLERMGWASFGTDGLWHVTDKAMDAAGAL